MKAEETQRHLIIQCLNMLSDATVMLEAADCVYKCCGRLAFVGTELPKRMNDLYEEISKLVEFLDDER